jgi:glycosyltransferase involved in cell wall biosynthesis
MAATLVLAGEFGSAAERDECRRSPGWARVDHRGFLDRQAVASVLGAARVGLAVLRPLPIFVDAYPTKLFEYMSVGLPVICSDFPLWREFVVENRCGFVVNPDDPGALAEALQRIFCDPGEARRMGERGRAAVERVYNWDPEAATLAALYERLTG